MKRHICKYCGKKRNESEMTLIHSDLFNKSAWVCSNHASIIADISDIRVTSKKPVFLELFAGSGHLTEAARQYGFEAYSLDNNPQLSPDILADILNIRNVTLPESVDVVWASVPCTWFSILNIANHWEKMSIGHRNYLYIPKTPSALNAIRILNATLKLIQKLNPTYYFIENPRGALRHFPQMKMIPYRHTVSYADYGFDYYKPTDIWTNCPEFKPKPIRSCVGKSFSRSVDELRDAYERSLLPGQLINEVLEAVTKKFKTIPGSVQ